MCLRSGSGTGIRLRLSRREWVTPNDKAQGRDACGASPAAPGWAFGLGEPATARGASAKCVSQIVYGFTYALYVVHQIIF